MDQKDAVLNVFNRNALLYQEKFMDVGLYKESFNLFLYGLKEHSTVLDIACGPGNITRFLLDQRPDLKIHGMDLAPEMIALAKINNPGASFEIMDCRELKNIQVKYDAVMCGFCLPYLSEEEANDLISDISQLLDPGGRLYLSTMEENDEHKSGYRTSSTGDEVYMYYHKSERLLEALKDSGFSRKYIKRFNYPGSDGKQVTDLVLLAEISEG